MDSAPDSDSRPAVGGDAATQKLSPSLMHGLLAAGAETRPSREWQPPSVEELQRLLPQYEISAFIARGGMGAVYKGVQKALKRPVAIKVLPPEADDGDLQFAERFKHEAQAMARLSHPNIVAVYEAGEVVVGGQRSEVRGQKSEVGDQRAEVGDQTGQEGQGSGQGGSLLYFVMEFIEGTDVHQLIASEGQVDARRAVQIITAVCDALAFAHEEGIIHRDIKPSNIMIDRKGRVKVADFGLAKSVHVDSTFVTRSDVAMGTPDFVAPEAMAGGLAIDQRADLYAVGVMLYQMLTGHIPRGRFSPISAVVPKSDPKLDAIVDKAMQADRDRRYRLPTDREWSFAVGIAVEESKDRDPIGLSQKVEGIHAWGTDWPPPSRVANLADKAFLSLEPAGHIIEGYEDGFATTAPVMSFPPNALGIHDLGGNVWEWCEDKARTLGEKRAARGGAFDTYNQRSLLASYRVENLPGYRSDLWGFRIVAEKPLASDAR